MPDQPDPIPDDPFDLGDTSLQLAEPSASDRPRNPDGTFKAADPEPAPAPPETPKHPAWLLTQAADLGMPDDEIEGMTTAALTRSVTRQLNNRNSFQATLAKERAQRQGQQQPAPKPEDDLGLGDLENEFDPRLVGALKKVHQTNKELRRELQSVHQRDQQRQQLDTDAQIDRAFEKLGDDYKAAFGEGSIHDLPQGADERERRFAVVSAAMRQQNGSIQARIAKAAKTLFPPSKKPDKPDESSEYLDGAQAQKKKPTEKEWANGAVAVPTQRKPSSLPQGRELAVKNLAARMAKQQDPMDESDLDGIPD